MHKVVENKLMKNVELNSTWNIFEDLFEIFINIEITCLFKKKFCKKQFYLTIH